MSSSVPCPDAEVYDRLGRIEQRLSADRVRWDGQKATSERVDDLILRVERLTTKIQMATWIIGALLTLAGIVVPLVRP